MKNKIKSKKILSFFVNTAHFGGLLMLNMLYNNYMKCLLRKALIIMISSIMCLSFCVLDTKAAPANWSINFNVVYDGSNFKLSGLNINLDSDVVKSLQVTYPASVTYNEPSLPSGWTHYAGTNTVNYQITSNGDVTSVTNFLNAMTFSGTYGTSTGNIQVELNDRSITSMTGDDGKPHYYEYISGPTRNVSWYTAYDGAKASTYNGLTGYLATITSEAENTFVYKSLFSNTGADSSSWIGGTRFKAPSDVKINDQNEVTSISSTLAGTLDWYWADGPEAAQSFFTKSSTGVGGTPIGFAAWLSTQPDGIPADSEGCAQFGYGGSQEKWNDLYCDGRQALSHGYIIEYSEYGSEVVITDKKTHSAPLPVPTPTPSPATPVPATPNPGRTCQDDGYPDGYYWNGSACVTDATPVPSTNPVVTVTPTAVIGTTKPVSPSPSVSPSASPSASASPSTSPSVSPSATPSIYIQEVTVNNEQYGILDTKDTIFGEEWYMEHFVSKEKFYAYPNLGVFVKANPCILHFLISLVALLLQILYNRKAKKDLKKLYEEDEENKEGDKE